MATTFFVRKDTNKVCVVTGGYRVNFTIEDVLGEVVGREEVRGKWSERQGRLKRIRGGEG